MVPVTDTEKDAEPEAPPAATVIVTALGVPW
jgi:hypothetical protein